MFGIRLKAVIPIQRRLGFGAQEAVSPVLYGAACSETPRCLEFAVEAF